MWKYVGAWKYYNYPIHIPLLVHFTDIQINLHHFAPLESKTTNTKCDERNKMSV